MTKLNDDQISLMYIQAEDLMDEARELHKEGKHKLCAETASEALEKFEEVAKNQDGKIENFAIEFAVVKAEEANYRAINYAEKQLYLRAISAVHESQKLYVRSQWMSNLSFADKLNPKLQSMFPEDIQGLQDCIYRWTEFMQDLNPISLIGLQNQYDAAVITKNEAWQQDARKAIESLDGKVIPISEKEKEEMC